MRNIVCPHCKTKQVFAAHVPRDVIVVMPCPSCYELVLLFRNKVIAVSRKIIEEGSREERKAHFADIIDAFLDEPEFSARPEGLAGGREETLGSAIAGLREEFGKAAQQPRPISREEIDHFVQIELKSIDNATYFKKHFGN